MQSNKEYSKAGTGKEYLRGGIRMRNGVAHVQIKGVGGNRPLKWYNADDLNVSSDVKDWLESVDGTESSLAGTGAKYVPALFRDDGVDGIHVQALGESSFNNRGYGYSFNAKNANLAAFLKKNLQGTVEEPKQESPAKAVPITKVAPEQVVAVATKQVKEVSKTDILNAIERIQNELDWLRNLIS